MIMILKTLLALLLTAAACAPQQNFHVYVGQLSHDSALIAWGHTSGSGNTIGRESGSHGKAELRVGDRRIETENNWARVEGLDPDTTYPYEVKLNGQQIGTGRLRTWAAESDRLTFFAIGDFGNASSGQRRVAEAMWREFERREAAGDHVRFVITTGDNIYADLNLGFLNIRSGDKDSHWRSKFFEPYAPLIARIPFLPTLGNHDGNATESRGDLAVYLDNFFFPGGGPRRWYSFNYGGLADFFALDTTKITASGPPAPAYLPEGQQFEWLQKEMAGSRARWKIPYFHNPLFNAGPGHDPDLYKLLHFFDLFRRSGVAVAFAGHEHNLQFSERNEATGNMLFVITGAGGELRGGNVRNKMKRAHIAAWAPQRHFLVVEIDGPTMTLTPVSYEEVVVRNAAGERVPMPVTVRLPSENVAR